MRNPWKNKGIIMGLKDILKGGALGVGASLVADNPKLLKGMGLLGNVAYNKIENREDDKRIAAEQAKEAEAMQKQKMAAKARRSSPQQAGTEGGYKGYAKGGKVSSASKRADGCAIKGKTKGRMI
jgi:hypothetical protein